jgi:hypothetical protein
MKVLVFLLAFVLYAIMIKPVVACTDSIIVSPEERIGFAKRVQSFATKHDDLIWLTLIFPMEEKGEKIESVSLSLRNELASKQLFVDLPLQQDGSVVLTVGADLMYKLDFQVTYNWCNHVYGYQVPKDLVYD